MDSAKRIEELSIAIDQFIGQINPRPKLTEAITACLCMCLYKIESELPEMDDLIAALRPIATAMLAAHIEKDIGESN